MILPTCWCRSIATGHEKLMFEKARAKMEELVHMQPVELAAPGKQDMKWVGLYDKFQLLVPS